MEDDLDFLGFENEQKIGQKEHLTKKNDDSDDFLGLNLEKDKK